MRSKVDFPDDLVLVTDTRFSLGKTAQKRWDVRQHRSGVALDFFSSYLLDWF